MFFFLQLTLAGILKCNTLSCWATSETWNAMICCHIYVHIHDEKTQYNYNNKKKNLTGFWSLYLRLHAFSILSSCAIPESYSLDVCCNICYPHYWGENLENLTDAECDTSTLDFHMLDSYIPSCSPGRHHRLGRGRSCSQWQQKGWKFPGARG